MMLLVCDAKTPAATYTYENANRVTRILHQGPSGVIEDLQYTYDAASNRTSLARANGTASLLPAAVASATYDVANEQVQFGSATLTYDANGNLTSDGTNTYTWDARNRLVGIIGGVSASFSYDGLGRRLSKTINGVTTSFVYDGNDIVQELSGGTVTANYLRSLDIDEPFLRQSLTAEFYHTDALWSILGLSDSTGTVATTYSYESFGKTTVAGSSLNSFQYTGRENDNTGLYYYRERYYSPFLQRFLGEDPVEFGGGDANLYAYVGNSPTNLGDPNGLGVVVLRPLPQDCLPPLDKQEKYLDRFLRELACSLNLLPSGGVIAGLGGKTFQFFGTNVTYLKTITATRLARRAGGAIEVFNSNLPGGLAGAREFFREQIGRLPSSPKDVADLGDRLFIFRPSSGGSPTVEVVNTAAGVIEKIRFLP